MIAYNIPSRVVLNLEPELHFRLSEIPNVVGVKQAMPDLDQARRIAEYGGLALYAGDDNLLLPFLELGGVGGICVCSHVAGPRFREMITLAQAGDLAGARRIDESLRPLVQTLMTITTNPIPLKAALNLLGHNVGGVRLPLVEATPEQIGQVRAALESAGIQAPATA